MVVLIACAAPTRPATPAEGGAGAEAPPPRAERTVVVAVRVEPQSLAAKPTRSSGARVAASRQLFNAVLDLVDDRGVARPYLAEALPELNTESWRVFPDGRMETSYRLKPGLRWHDGTPLSAEDFVLAHRVFSVPDLGFATTPPTSLIKDVVASDDRSFRIRWSRPYPGAGVLQDGGTSEFPPVPRHLLTAAFQEAQWEAFSNHPYWTREFVGLGPFRLERWEPGAFIEGSAFAGHVLGRPKIDNVRIVFISDANTAVANLLSGAIHLSADTSIYHAQGRLLNREWRASGNPNAGTVLTVPDLWRAVYAQLRPELASPRAILDVRVRRALAHAVNRAAVIDALYEGEGILAETILPAGTTYYPTIEASLVKYPYDLRRAEQLMAEAGFRPGPGGFYTHPVEGRFTPELKTTASVNNETERTVLAAGWREAGVDIQEAALPAAQGQDGQARASFPSLYVFSTGVTQTSLRNFASSAIPRPENRWSGSNRGAWSNPEYDSLIDSFNVTLEPAERVRMMARMTRIISEELPAISLHYELGVFAHVGSLRGPRAIVPETSGTVAWNVSEWELN
jgi:peptide/nickel transport system substrate-binding protein